MRTSHKGTRFPVETLTQRELAALIRAAKRPRDRALLITLWRSGLRCKELLDLTPNDIDFETRTFNVKRGKGGKQRHVSVGHIGMEGLKPWLAVRSEIPGVNGVNPVFCTREGKKLGTDQVRRLFKLLAKRAGITKRCHPHQMRHCFSYEMLQEGNRIDIISRQLGHSRLATTAEYISHLASPEISAVMDARKVSKVVAEALGGGR